MKTPTAGTSTRSTGQGHFTGEELTLGQAAEIAGISQTELMRELSRRRIPLHYDLAELAEDLQSIASLNAHQRTPPPSTPHANAVTLSG